jgi:hypothetical protein
MIMSVSVLFGGNFLFSYRIYSAFMCLYFRKDLFWFSEYDGSCGKRSTSFSMRLRKGLQSFGHFELLSVVSIENVCMAISEEGESIRAFSRLKSECALLVHEENFL